MVVLAVLAAELLVQMAPLPVVREIHQQLHQAKVIMEALITLMAMVQAVVVGLVLLDKLLQERLHIGLETVVMGLFQQSLDIL
jgi:hypothetical protein